MAPKAEAPKSSANLNLKVTESKDGKEVYTAAPVALRPLPATGSKDSLPPPPEEDEDDLSTPVAAGTVCKRKGCGKAFVSDEVSRSEDGEEAVCVYHPLPVRSIES